MKRRRKRSGLGYNRGGLTRVSREYRQAVLRRKRGARKACPMFQQRARELVELADKLPGRFQPILFHRLKLAESAADHGNCKTAYREIGDAKRFAKKHQRSDED